MDRAYPEAVTVRLPEGTNKRTEPFLAPRQSLAAFWRQKMLEWLRAAEEKK